MATNEMTVENVSRPGSGRNFEHRFFAVFAALFVIAVLIGFGPTFYLKPLFSKPPIARTIIFVHGFVMASWVALFVTQVYFISAKKIKLHQKLGVLGCVIACLLVVTGFFLTVAAAKYGSPSTPPNVQPLSFMIVPFGDLIVFSILVGTAVYFRKKAANHKRLILLTMICLLPPAIARFPGGMTENLGPLWFYGVPTLLAVAFIAIDTWRNGKLNKAFLFGGIFLVGSMWLRLPLSTTPQWLDFATWLTS